jgi:hypothetical protein
VKGVLEKTTKFILPFAVLSDNRKEPFTLEIERTAIFCMAELERAKGGGLVVKQSPEKLSFIAKVCYPFWLVTLGESSFLFDGLDTTSYTLTYSAMPDIQTFLDNVNRSSKTRHAYTAFLSDNINYFQVSDIEKKKVIDGLVSDPEFLNEFSLYSSEAAPAKTPLSGMAVVAPALDEALISSVTEEIQKLKSRFAAEVNALYSSMKLVNSKTEGFVKGIRSEIKETEKKFSKEIEKCRVSIAEKAADIREEHDGKVTKLSNEVEDELLSLRQEMIKLEKTKEQLLTEIERCEAEIRTCTINKDNVSERKWREDRDEFKRQFSEVDTEIKELSKRTKTVEDEKKLQMLNLKSDRDAKIKEASKNLMEIESSRDAKIRISEEEMERLEELTSSIIVQINELAKVREASITEFDKLGFRQKRKETALIYMPFYLASYKCEQRKRYECFPPSTVNSISLSVKIKAALGKSKIKRLLEPRFKTLVSFLNGFPQLMEQNAVFDRDMNEACVEVDVLRTKELRESIKTGLEKIREEGWFSEKEFESFSQSLNET